MIEISNILDVKKYIDDFKVFIFDLDDTLYSEVDYVKSGYKSIANNYPNIHNLYEELWNAFLKKEPAIDFVLNKLGMISEKDRFLSIYRNHIPNIELYPGVFEMLAEMHKNKKLGIITDGRVEGQKAKINSLKISNLFDKIIITDEIGGIEFRKPNKKAFMIMKEFFNCDYCQMCYIGDNIKKDGIAPEQLGMNFIYFNNSNGLYK